MKRLLKMELLPAAAGVLGILGMVLRKTLYLRGTDVFGLLVKRHPLEAALWLLTILTTALVLASVWKMQPKTGARYHASFFAALGHILLAAGILLTVLPMVPKAGMLGGLWRYSGVLCGPLLVYAALCRAQGKKPSFLVYVVCSLFCVFHLVNHYQLWCSNPQLQDYLFAFAATICLMLCAYHLAALGVGMGDSRAMWAVSLLGLYLCLVSMADLQDLYLYLGGAAFCGLSLSGLEEWTPPEQKAGENNAAS